MKKYSLIINAVLFAAIVVLYVLHFTGNKNDKKSVQETVETANIIPQGSGPSLAYVNIDSLLINYDMYFDLKKQLTDKFKSLEAQLNNLSKEYEKSVGEYQYKVQKQLVTRSQAQEIEQKLVAEQQRLLKLRDDYTMQMAEEEQVMNNQILHSITEYIEEYNKGHKYNMVFGTTSGGNLLYADDAMNITQIVLQGLNTKYTAERAK